MRIFFAEEYHDIGLDAHVYICSCRQNAREELKVDNKETPFTLENYVLKCTTLSSSVATTSGTDTITIHCMPVETLQTEIKKHPQCCNKYMCVHNYLT